jgi:putative nucleotidyltransferase with HDIG domain
MVVDPLRGASWRQVTFNASVFAVAAAAGGLAYEGLAEPGAIHLPEDLAALGALALVYYAVNTGLVGAIIAFSSGALLAPLVRETFASGLPSALGEAALAYALARRAAIEPWAIVALVPLVFAVYHAHARLAMLKRETARALETFANVVDERDPITYRHSERVADHVEGLARSLRMPLSATARLRWAGRLHDLGKMVVDPEILNKPGRLNDAEWAVMRRHPRLSARMLRRFRFAAGEARAVEYHHERYDGTGYYGVSPGRIPLAAHFLIVADSFDAMTSDRPYRAAMPPEEALRRIEEGAGTQFHPLVARAFVAMERGLDPQTVLHPSELKQLRAAGAAAPDPRRVLRLLDERQEVIAALAVAGSLGAAAFERWWLAGVVLGVAALLLARRVVEQARARRLAERLRGLARRPEIGPEDVAAVLLESAEVEWAGVVARSDRDASVALLGSWGDGGAAPGQTALAGWLVREVEEQDSVHAVEASELGTAGSALAVDLAAPDGGRRFLVLVFARAAPRELKLALQAVAGELGPLVPEPAAVEPPSLPAAA